MKTLTIAVGLSVAIFLSAIGAYARNGSSQRTTSTASASSVRSSPARSTYSHSSSGSSQGSAKVSARAGSYSRSGYRGGGGGGHYFHNGFRGHNGWGSRWPYWSVGAYFSYLPDDYTTYYVNGSPYYYCDGSYFSPYSSGGYLVVPAPDLSNATTAEPAVQAAPEADVQPAEQAQSASSGSIIINVPNSKDGFTPVKLVKSKGGYIGPQGELYAGHPTVAELKVLYGD